MPDARGVRNANVAAHRLSWKARLGGWLLGITLKPQSGRGSLRRPPFFLRRKRSRSRAKRPPHHRHSQPFIASECTRTNLGRPERKNDLRPRRLEPNTWAALLGHS